MSAHLVLLLFASQAPAAKLERPGPLALCAEPFVLERALCDELCPGATRTATRLKLTIGDGAGAPDLFAALDAEAVRVELDPQDVAAAETHALAAKVEGARAIELAGGTWIDWWVLLTPQNKPTRLCEALRAAHRSGTAIGASRSAAAFLVGAAPIARSLLSRPRRNAHDPRAFLFVEGLAWMEGIGLDCGSGSSTSTRALFDAGRRDGRELYLHLSGESAWIVDASGRTARLVGSGTALWFELADARRDGADLLGLRARVLAPGTRYDTRARLLRLPPPVLGPELPPSATDSPDPDAFAVANLRAALEQDEARVLADATARLELGPQRGEAARVLDLHWH
jgi:cyanophycinase-like exopeptidase